MRIPSFYKKIPFYKQIGKLYYNHVSKYGHRNNKQQRANLIEIRRFCKKNGVDFNCIISPADLGFEKERGYSYEPSYSISKIISYLEVSDQDSVIDFGCGKGWAMYQLAQLPFGRVDGLELSKELIDIAKSNMKKLFPTDERFSFFHCDVLDFKDLDNYNYVYMFNPFPGMVFNRMMKEVIMESLSRKPREFTIIYHNPQFAKLIEQEEIFECVFSADNTKVYKAVLKSN